VEGYCESLRLRSTIGRHLVRYLEAHPFVQTTNRHKPFATQLARQMGGDAPLLAQIITLQTIVAAVTMPVAIALAAWF
jgi:hypothetical protein